jgi:hypothetical protein
MYKIRILPKALRIAHREGVPDEEIKRQALLIQETTQQDLWQADARISRLKMLIPNRVYRFRMDEQSKLRTVFEEFPYNEAAQQETGLRGVLHILGYYQRDDETYRRAKLDYEED